MDLVAGRAFASERRPIRHVDPILIAVALILSGIGLALVYSATHQSLQALDLDPATFLRNQATGLALGIGVLLLTATFDYRFLKVYAGFVYGAMVLLLVLVRTPLGSSTAGAQRWFELFGFQFTPSEFMKIALIVMLAAFLSEVKSRDVDAGDLYRVVLLGAVPALLVFLQPDMGTSIVLAAIMVGMLIVAGARARYLVVLAIAGIVLLFGAFQLGIVKDYQVARLTGFLDPTNDPLQTGYNRTQAEIAVGSGGLTGLGYLHGTQTNLDFVPEQHTDFIFTVVGEEFGFVGGMAVLLLFGLLLWRAFRAALLSKDAFGSYLAAGIATMFAVQMFVNVGMVIGIMPITGIPLPFVSYGRSSLLASFLGIGLLLNVHMRRLT
jgi:rod shape determining protein RodA